MFTFQNKTVLLNIEGLKACQNEPLKSEENLSLKSATKCERDKNLQYFFFDDDEKFIRTQITQHRKHSLLIRVILMCMSAAVWIALVK